ncbi:hypothetical protein LPYR103PRE_02370 [Segatella asaccharophila]|jgi:hypothetical protein
MTDWVRSIIDIFIKTQSEQLSIEETEDYVSLEFYFENKEKRQLPSSFPNGYVSSRDNITIRWKDYDDEDYENTDFISSKNNWIDFSKDFNKTSDENLTVKVQISKNVSNHIISVYDYKIFSDYLVKLDYKVFIRIFNDLDKKDCSYFEVQNKNFQCWNTNTFVFIGKKATCTKPKLVENKLARLELWKHTCKSDIQDINLLPDDFYIRDYSSTVALQTKFHNACIALSLAYIANDTNSDDLGCHIHLSGYSVINKNIDLEKTKFDFNNWNLLKIYQWIYANEQIYDKLNIARNILSLNGQTNLLDTTDEVLGIMVSNHNIFIKENVDRFIKVRNDISNFLLSYRSKVDEAIDKYVDRMRQNMLVVASFILSTIILKVISKENVSGFCFSASILWIIMILIVVSAVQLWLNYRNISSKEPKYDKILSSVRHEYSSLLDEGELKVLKDADEDWGKKKKRITGAWISTLIILVLADIVFLIFLHR